MQRASLTLCVALVALGCAQSKPAEDSPPPMLSSSGKALGFKAMARRYLDEARTGIELVEDSPTSDKAQMQRTYLADLYTRIPLP